MDKENCNSIKKSNNNGNSYHCPFPSTEDNNNNKNDKLSTPRRLPLTDKANNKTPLQSGPQRVLVKEKMLSSSASKVSSSSSLLLLLLSLLLSSLSSLSL